MAYAVIDCSDILKTSKVIIEMHDAAVRCVNLCVMSRADVRDGFIAMAIKDFHSRVPSDKATYGICMSLNMERKKIRELRSPCSASKRFTRHWPFSPHESRNNAEGPQLSLDIVFNVVYSSSRNVQRREAIGRSLTLLSTSSANQLSPFLTM